MWTCPTLDVDSQGLAAFDLPPFEAAIESRVSGIMLSHIRYSRIDPKWPASLSHRIAGTLLRHEMGYDGLVLTDDLDMGAIAKHYDIHTAVYRLLSADIDIALICHRTQKIETACDEIRKSITDSGEMRAKAAGSLKRILGPSRRISRGQGFEGSRVQGVEGSGQRESFLLKKIQNFKSPIPDHPLF